MNVPAVASGSPAGRARPDAPHTAIFDDVYAQHAGFVFRVLRGMGVPDAHADDALQEVFIVVHRRLPEFDGRARITTWLFQIALRVASAQRKRTRRARDHTPISDALPDLGDSPHTSAESAQSRDLLSSLLLELDEDKRATIVLAELEGMTAPEIAELTGTPLNTVYTRLRRARAEFAQRYAERTGGRHE